MECRRLGLLLLLLCPWTAEARLLQIIHTNDLHSHFEHSQDYRKGNYAAVKAQIDRLKAEAQAQGIDTLVMDAGDFSEGTQWYLVDQGEQSWKMIDAMGYDAVVLGNHDYLMGQDDLDRVVGHVRPGFSLVCANFQFYNDLQNLNRYLHPYVELRRSGMRIAVVGFTTDDFVYRWRVGQLTIDPPQEIADKVVPELKSRNDFVIALTHLGVGDDKSLAAKTHGLDLIVGGHSHTFLHDPVMQKGPDGKVVPIVQAGEHGEAVGDLLVDLEPGQPVKVLRYQLVPVSADGPRDARMDELLGHARQRFEAEYGHDWLHEVIGYSEVPLEIPWSGPTPWGNLVADAMRESVNADLSVDAGGQLFGDTQPAGPVTREQLFIFYPRVFGFQEREGWSVWTTKVYGWVLKFVLQIAVRQGLHFNLSNASFDVTGVAGKQKLKNFMIGGEKLHAMKSYRVALPEGIGRAVDEIIPPLKLFLRSPKDRKVAIWKAVEDKLRQVGVVKPSYPR